MVDPHKKNWLFNMRQDIALIRLFNNTLVLPRLMKLAIRFEIWRTYKLLRHRAAHTSCDALV